MLTFLLIASLFLFIIYRFVKFWILEPWSIHRYLWKQGIPGKYIPIIGDLLDRRRALLADDPYSLIREMTVKYGDYYHSSFGPKASLHISDSSLIEGVLKTNARAYHKSTIARTFLGLLIGYENILLAEDEQHSRHRRLIAPVFQHQNINSMIELMVERTSSFLEKWTASTNDPLILNIHEEMINLTLDNVSICVFGSEITTDQYTRIITAIKEMEKSMLNVLAIIPIINRLPLPNKRRTDQSRKNIKQVVQHIINQRKEGLTKAVCKGSDLLDLILTVNGDEKTRKFTDEEVLDEAITFIFAGHDSTSALMTWTLYNLVNNPDVYHRCQAEIDSVLNDNDNDLTASTISLLTYTEAVLKESLRYQQPVPLMLRTAIEDNTIVASNGKHIYIRKGTDVVVNLQMLHRSEKYWHEPNKFDPSRFEEPYPDAFLPFGLGPRSCIGQHFAMLEAKIILALIMRRFHFELVPGQKHVPDVAISYKPKYGMWMRIFPR